MESFDMYYFEGTESETFFTQPIQIGNKVWLDGIDGFFDQYFESCAAIERDVVRFVPVRNGVTAIPTSCSEFESLSLVEAKIINNQMLYAEVRVTQVLSLGNWARTISLPIETQWKDMTSSEFSQEMFFDLWKEMLEKKCALRTFSRKDWKHSRIKAVYLFKTKSDVRCIVLEDNAVPSVLFRVNGES